MVGHMKIIKPHGKLGYTACYGEGYDGHIHATSHINRKGGEFASVEGGIGQPCSLGSVSCDSVFEEGPG